MKDYVLTATKSKADKWKKLCGDEDRRTLIIEWWEKKELTSPLVIAQDAKGQFEPQYGFPDKQARNKAVYFIKPDEGFTVTKENVTQLLKGDISRSRESSVVDWSHQVNDVLKHDSAQPLIDGLNVGPLIELDLWQQLWNATQQVFLPILQFNAKSIDSKRIISDLQKLIASIQVCGLSSPASGTRPPELRAAVALCVVVPLHPPHPHSP